MIKIRLRCIEAGRYEEFTPGKEEHYSFFKGAFIPIQEANSRMRMLPDPTSMMTTHICLRGDEEFKLGQEYVVTFSPVDPEKKSDKTLSWLNEAMGG